MIRRAVASLALVGALTGCTTFSDADAIARVGDDELSQELLDQLAPVLAGPGLEVGAGTGQNADAVRNIIGQWIQVAVIEDHLIASGLEVTSDERDEAAARVASDPLAADLSDATLDFFTDAQAAFDKFSQLPDPAAVFADAAADSDIVVASRYGTFNAEVLSVLPLGASPALFDL